MKVRTFTAVIHREDDLYVATCPELGTVSQGTTIEGALANLKEATELYLEEFPCPTWVGPCCGYGARPGGVKKIGSLPEAANGLSLRLQTDVANVVRPASRPNSAYAQLYSSPSSSTWSYLEMTSWRRASPADRTNHRNGGHDDEPGDQGIFQDFTAAFI